MPTEAPLAIRFANSRYAVRGRPQEGIGTVEDLTTWLREHLSMFEVSNVNIRNVHDFVELRDAARGVFRACVSEEPPTELWISVINQAAAAAPHWPVLQTSYIRYDASCTTYDASCAEYAVVEQASCSALDAARGAIARDVMSLVAGPLRAELRSCDAPGCVRFFVKDHPRREWCCDHCGNRARAARHYQRHKGG